jgi:DNA modification methylase
VDEPLRDSRPFAKRLPRAFPVELAERLIRMFSFVGDTVLDPFMGTASTNVAASRWGRNSIGIEVDPEYYEYAAKRMDEQSRGLFGTVTIRTGQCRLEQPVSRK